jgi:D-glycero-alpha-D-manno-heptose-7-phosphate kinase
MEEVDRIDDIKHPLIREALRLVGWEDLRLEITSMADVPAGTGLGSSGSFTTALLKALHVSQKNLVHTAELAEQACKIEIDILKEPVGKQDQYIAAFGGITCFRFLPNGQVEVWPLKISQRTLYDMEDHLLLFFTGYTRSAGEILKEQDVRSKQNDPEMIANMHFVKQLGRDIKDALEGDNLTRFGELMNTHWEYKKGRSKSMSNERINHWYELAMANGALGGKLIGAGGGGFLMFLCEERARLRQVLTDEGLEEVRFRFDFEGTKVILQ